MAKALNCPNCAAALNPHENNCEYCGSYIITSNAKQVTYDLKEFKPTFKKIYFHEIEMGVNEFPIRSGTGNMFYSLSKSDGGRLLLTNQRLIFCAHAFNINPNLYWELSLNNINRTELGLNLLISQRILIFDREGSITTFVVYGGQNWLNEINRATHLNK